jgi:hypothetical protein
LINDLLPFVGQADMHGEPTATGRLQGEVNVLQRK